MQIDKNIPLPLKRDRITKYPWPQMTPGDSVFLERYGDRVSVATAGAAWFKKNKPEWAIRVAKEGDGFRVFCIERKNGSK